MSSNTKSSQEDVNEQRLKGAVAVRKLDWFMSPFSDGGGDVEHEEVANSPAQKNQVVCGYNNGSDPIKEEKIASNNSLEYPYAWRAGELASLLSSGDDSKDGHGGRGLVILASDVIYDEGLTEAFFGILKTLMPPPSPPITTTGSGKTGTELNSSSSGVPKPPPPSSAAPATAASSALSPVLFMALEKRFNFTIAELSVVATGYKALLRNVLDVTTAREDSTYHPSSHFMTGGDVSTTRNCHSATREACSRDRQEDTQIHHQAFEGVRLPLKFAQCFQYQRSAAMELWEIRRRPLC